MHSGTRTVALVIFPNRSKQENSALSSDRQAFMAMDKRNPTKAPPSGARFFFSFFQDGSSPFSLTMYVYLKE